MVVVVVIINNNNNIIKMWLIQAAQREKRDILRAFSEGESMVLVYLVGCDIVEALMSRWVVKLWTRKLWKWFEKEWGFWFWTENFCCRIKNKTRMHPLATFIHYSAVSLTENRQEIKASM